MKWFNCGILYNRILHSTKTVIDYMQQQDKSHKFYAMWNKADKKFKNKQY